MAKTSKLAHAVLARYLGAARAPKPPSKVAELFEPFLVEHDEFIRNWVSDSANRLRHKALELYPKSTSSKYGFGRTFKERVQWDTWIDKNGQDKLKGALERYRTTYSGTSLTDQESANLYYERDWREGPNKYQSDLSRELPSEVQQAVLSFGWDGVHDSAVFKKAVDKEIKWSIENNRAKITDAIDKALGKLPVASVIEVSSQIDVKGIEGEFKITLADGTEGSFATRSIGAGGWNIQRFHFRYLLKISQNLKELNLQEKAKAGLSPEVVGILRILAPFNNAFVKEHGLYIIPKEARWAVEGLPGSSRNWGPLVREGLIEKRGGGRHFFGPAKYFLTEKGMKALDSQL